MKTTSLRSRLGWDGMGWRRGHGVLPKESVRVGFFYNSLSILYFFLSVLVLVAFQRVPQPETFPGKKKRNGDVLEAP